MKKCIINILCSLCLAFGVLGQSPQGFSYQAEIRNDNGDLLVNQQIGVRISIIEGSTSGNTSYAETHDITTSDLGKLTLQIGGGDSILGDFNLIDWGANVFFVEVAIDENGGNNFEAISNSQLLSVPYALYASESASSSGDFELPFNGVFDSSNIPVFELSNVNGNNNVIAINNDGDGDGAGIIINNNNPDGAGLRILNNGDQGLSINNGVDANASGIVINNNANENSIIINHNSGNQDALVIDMSNSATGLAARFEGANVLIEENLEVGEDMEIGNNLDVSNSIEVGDSIFIDEDIEAGGVLIVEGLANIGGNMVVQGNLSKGGGSFKIDHPLDPYNKYLYHSFVESPDMMNIYNGMITTDSQGYAQVQMPEWFMTLNIDFRYQLTLIGTFGQAIVKEKMNDSGNFIIQTSNANMEVSWQVTGIRNDNWAQQNRIPIEEDKVGKQKGQLLHPNTFGTN